MTPAFRDWVERARGAHIAAILQEHGVKLAGRGRNRAGPCPKCGGDDRFAVDLDKQLFNCRGCGGKGHGAISLTCFLDGVSFLQAVETINGEPPPKDEPKPATSKQRKRGRFVCAYPYCDEYDTEQYQVCRYADPKSFSQRRPDPDHPGEWIGDLTGVRLVPYHLSDLIEGIANGHPVYLVEGEKDADNGIATLGIIATTTAMGTAGKKHWEAGTYDEFFRGADVILVPDQETDPKKGKRVAEFTRIIIKRLKPIAARLQVLTLPVKDLSDWIEAGGTREDFDELPLEGPIETNGHDHQEDGSSFADLWQPPGDLPLPAVVEPTVYLLPAPETIPARVWLFAMHYIRKAVTATVAPGGFGKTTLALFEALSMVALGYRIWYVSGEDDREEIDRRIAAHWQLHKPPPLEGRLFVDDKASFPLKIAGSTRHGPLFDDAKLIAFEQAIKDRQIDVVILDPFVSFHGLPENDTAAMDALIRRLSLVCQHCNCCIELSHHVRKPGIGQLEITVYDARGAGAIINATRSCRVINQMTVNEAQQIKIDTPQRYIRVDSGKRNMAPPEKAHWFELVSQTIANGDSVQALKPYDFKPERITLADDDWLKLTLTNGREWRADSRSPDWLGHAIAEHFGRDAETPGDITWINTQIKIWMGHGKDKRKPLLRKVMRNDKDRKPRTFFELVEKPEEKSSNVVPFKSSLGSVDDDGSDDLD